MESLAKIPIKYRRGNVPEAYNTRQNNEIFRECQLNNLPFFAIRKGRKYAHIEYDFIATSHQLTDTAKKEIESIVTEMATNSGQYGFPVVCSMGKTLGISLQCQLELCREYAPILRDIVYNPNNWELSNAGKLKEALNSDDPAKAMFELEIKK